MATLHVSLVEMIADFGYPDGDKKRETAANQAEWLDEGAILRELRDEPQPICGDFDEVLRVMKPVSASKSGARGEQKTSVRLWPRLRLD
jgi:hypothetical protein